MGYWDLLDLLYIAEMYRRDDKPSPVASSSLSVNVLSWLAWRGTKLMPCHYLIAYT